MKRNILILIGLLGFVLGAVDAFISVKLSLLLLAGAVVLAVLLLDYQRVAYVVGAYPLLYFITNRIMGNTFLANAWDELLLVFCIAVWFYKWFVHRKDEAYKWTPLEFPLIFLFAISFFLLFFKAPDRLGFDGLRAVIEYMVFYFVVVQLLRSEKGAKRLIYVMVFVGAYMAFVGIYQYIVKVDTPTFWMDKVEISGRPRVYSIVGNPNILGSLMVLLIPLALSLVLNETKIIKKLIFAGAAASMTLCLLFTGSRSSWIAFGIALFIFALLSKNMKIIIGLAFAGVFAYLLVPSVQNRISYMLTQEFINSSFKAGRFVRWPKAIELFQQNLWTGVGFGRFGGSVASLNKVPGSFYIDNYYLKAAVEMGIFGLVSFCLLLYNSLAWSLRALRRVDDKVNKGIIQSAIGGLVGILVTNVPLNNFDAPSVTTYFWITTAVVIYLGFADKRNKSLISPLNA